MWPDEVDKDISRGTVRGRWQEAVRSRGGRAYGRLGVIRQTISCDICKCEKKQLNHWFVAYEQGMELRVSGWNSRYRMRAESKHVCGQACLYKLMDEFLARVIQESKPAQIEAERATPVRARAASDTSLTSSAAYIEVESVRLITPAAKPELVPMPVKAENTELPLVEEPRYGSRNWRAEAWERERGREREQRELHDVEGKPDLLARHGL
jgi:hypothetical protein